MRVAGIGLGAAACVMVATLTACTSSGPGRPTTPASDGATSPLRSLSESLSSGAPTIGSVGTKSNDPFCTKLRDAGARIQQAQVKLYTSSGGDSSAVTALVTELNQLKDGAPASIKSALGDLATAFTAAQQALAHPASTSSTQLAQIGSKLATDAQQVSAYVASKC